MTRHNEKSRQQKSSSSSESNIGSLTTCSNAGGNLVGQNCVWMLFKLSPSDDENHKSYCCGDKKKEKKDKKSSN